MGKLLSVGEMVIDFLPGTEENSYIRRAGGAPANVAVAMARQGCPAVFCGTVGNDDFGRFLCRTLEENGVESQVVLTDQATTTMAFVSLSDQGERSFTFARKPGADMFLTKEQLREELLDSADLVHAGSCSLSKGPAAEATAYALAEGSRRGKLVSFDVNYRDLMWDGDSAAAAEAVKAVLPWVDFLKISEEEADLLGGEEALPRKMADYGITLLVETLGSRGARCYWKDRVLEVAAQKAECVDSCGAGDAYWGGFLAALWKAGVRKPQDVTEDLLREAMERGGIAGWLCVQKKGAIESLPTAETVEKYWEAFYR